MFKGRQFDQSVILAYWKSLHAPGNVAVRFATEPARQHHRSRPPAGSDRKKGPKDQALGHSRGGTYTS